MSHPWSDPFQSWALTHTAAGRAISQLWERPLVDYLKGILPRRGLAQGSSSRVLLDVLETHARRDVGAAAARQAVMEFSRVPMIQLADGADLLGDVETILNHLMFQITCRENNISYMWTQQCTTVKALTSRSPLRGPAILETDQDYLQVFGGSIKSLESSNVACMSDVEFTFRPLGRKLPVYAGVACPDLMARFQGRRYERASDGILAANRWMWSQLRVKARKRLLLFGEEVSVDVVRQFLEDDTSLIARILLDPVSRQAFLQARAAVVGAPDNLVLRGSTDFFWGRDGRRLRPLRVCEGDPPALAVVSKGHVRPFVTLSRDALTDRLERGDLYPDLLLGYTVLSLLPGVVAVGGASQHEYLPRIRDVLLLAHELCPVLDSTDHERLREEEYSRLIGPALLELSPRQRRALLSLSTSTRLDDFEADAFRRAIGETAGTFEYLQYFQVLRDRKRSVEGVLE